MEPLIVDGRVLLAFIGFGCLSFCIGYIHGFRVAKRIEKSKWF